MAKSDNPPDWGMMGWEKESIEAFRKIVDKAGEKTPDEHINILMSALVKAHAGLVKARPEEKEKYYGYIIGFAACLAVLHGPIGGIFGKDNQH